MQKSVAIASFHRIEQTEIMRSDRCRSKHGSTGKAITAKNSHLDQLQNILETDRKLRRTRHHIITYVPRKANKQNDVHKSQQSLEGAVGEPLA